MTLAGVPALLEELSALGVQIEPDGGGGLRVSVPRSVVSPAEVARRVRAVKPELLEHFSRAAVTKPAQGPERSRADSGSGVPCCGLEPWLGASEVYGADAGHRRHAPPRQDAPEDRPHASPLKVCGGCARWTPDGPGAEGGSCSAGWAAHDLPPMPELGPHPVTSRGSRCWAYGGRGWRKVVTA